MNYTLHQLKIFLKVVELQSVTKASEALYLTQPAVSIQLKKLQDQFDVPLTEVIGRKLYVTEFGYRMAQTAQRIITEAETIDHTINQYKGLLAGKIRIAVVSTGKYVLPYFIAQFVNQHKGINFNIDVTNKSSVLRNIENNEVDFAMVSVLPENLDVEKIELMKNELHLVGNAESPYSKSRLSTKRLEELPLIFRENGSATRNVMEEFLKSKKLSLKAKLELVSNEAVKQAVIAGLGYSIMPLIGMRTELKNGQLKIIEVNGLPISTHWYLIYNKGKRLSPAAEALVTYINVEKDRIIKNYFKD